jgi:hypothetical protein
MVPRNSTTRLILLFVVVFALTFLAAAWQPARIWGLV